MLTRYHNRIFSISPTKKPIKIWRYDYVEGFMLQQYDDGLSVYKRFVELSELDEIFDVGFAVKWNDDLFYCLPDIQAGTAYLRTSDQTLAEKHGFMEEETDRGVTVLWYRVVSLDECTEFQFHKTIFANEYFTEGKNDAKSDTFEVLSRDAWTDMYRKTVYELSPWNFTNKN